MVLCIGEILADMICERRIEGIFYKRCLGGAPFNVACAIKKCGGEVAFYGKVGDDSIGRALVTTAQKCNLDYLNISTDFDRNTTLAFVDLDESGDRSFTFYRKNTADFHLLLDEVCDMIAKANIVHLGSLMLSEEEGREFADGVYREAKRQGKKFSFDVNFREDIFRDRAAAIEIYRKYVRCADILKLSESEIGMFSSAATYEDALKEIASDGKFAVLTLGKDGAMYCYEGKCERIETIPLKPIDTTGAGDAFYGALLSKLDREGFEKLDKSVFFANVCGSITTTRKGSAEAVPSLEEINQYL